jgi:metallo-beta-lactamase family protein
MQVQFCGAAREVTGSCHLFTVGDTRFLVDCGMHQGGREAEAENFAPFPFDPTQIDFLLLTHAHIDHSGLIPKLSSEGFSGPVYATPATADLAHIMLLDSAYIHEMEAEWRDRKARRAGRTAGTPLYTRKDAEGSLRLFRAHPYGLELEPAPGVKCRFLDAGHILGSSIMELWLKEGGLDIKVVVSGDLGQPDQPIIRDPEVVTEADYLLLESTYGDRLHGAEIDPLEELAGILEEAKASGGNVVIPAFAVGRTQELVYFLRQICEGHNMDMPIYVDSPLAKDATDIFRRHREEFDEEALHIRENGPLFSFPGLQYTESADESRELNTKSGVIIISASGMAEAGRIKHHLKHNLWRPESHIVIVGYQAPGTRGRRILDGEKVVRIYGEDIAVRAKVHLISGLSAHADRDQLLDWAAHMGPPRLTFLVHGEALSSFSLASTLEERLGFRVEVPRKYQTFPLE